MKVALVLCCTLVIILGSASANPVDDFESHWVKFKNDFNKKYDTPELEFQHKEIFRKSLKEVEEHNAKFAKGQVTYTKGINQFSDLTEAEMEKHRGLKPIN